MKKDQRKKADPSTDNLRHRAEEHLGATPSSPIATAEDSNRLVHELQVHQIELEMQNDELRRSRDEVETLLAEYSDLYDFAPVGYFSLAAGGTIRQVNLAGSRLLGVDRAKLIGKRFRSVVAPEDRPALDAFLNDVFGGKGKGSCAVALHNERLAEPLFASIEGSLSPAGETCRVAVMDITARKRAEEALERTMVDLSRSNKELERYAYVASHDLQEPLRSVTTYLGLLKRYYKNEMPPEVAELISSSTQAATRMSAMIRDLLAYSRVGSSGVKPRPIDAQTALDQVLFGLASMIAESNASITHDELPTVIADGTLLGQLFQNLIGNAIKFRTDKKPEIHVGARENDREWEFSVRDNGIGIKPEFFDRIFEVFQRLHTQTEYEGTGIGLAVCRRIVQQLGGRIWVESQAGAGSTFFFTIPKPPDA